MSNKHRLNRLEKKIPGKHKPEFWLTVTFSVLATDAEKETARLAAIKEYEQAHGHELNRGEVNWIEISEARRREEQEESDRRNDPGPHYPYITRTFD